MKLTRKTARRQQEILERIRKGLPVAGLLTGLVALTGCDNPLHPVGIEPHVVGKYTAESREKTVPEPVVGTTPAKAPQPRTCTRTAGEQPVPPPPPPPQKVQRTAGLPPPPPQVVGIEPKKAPNGK